MIIAKVVGNVVSVVKHPDYEGRSVFIVQPMAQDGRLFGMSFLAVDGVQAGIGDKVLVIDEGASARLVLEDSGIVTIRTVICGIVDKLEL